MSRGKPQKADARGGTYFLLPSCLLKSEAWRTASNRAVKALFVVAGRHTGFNNGKIAVPATALAEGMDCQNHHANSAALAELCARGILEQTSKHARGVRLAREFRLTFIPTETAATTHDYLGWRVGDAGTRGKKRVATTAIETSVSVATTAIEAKLSIATTATDEKRNDAKQPVLVGSTVATTAMHIGNHLRDARSDRSGSGKNASGHFAKSGEVISAAPDPDELRERTLALIGKLGRGTQGRLARQSGIPGGTLSRFIHRDGPLSESARIKLTCAFPRTEVAALRNERIAR
ncbi:MAG TPA: hypothetical protein VF631_05255 [Allosphingosinicella sp.]|jgi:hypothetical protein|uniref:hypothetical protein n=1 Tax=Allosphingosinicella sp. TaxID=2823234 RepID=UPI002F2AA6C5